jgi:hypothetical protein
MIEIVKDKVWNKDKNEWEIVDIKKKLEFDEKGKMMYSERRI